MDELGELPSRSRGHSRDQPRRSVSKKDDGGPLSRAKNSRDAIRLVSFEGNRFISAFLEKSSIFNSFDHQICIEL